MTVFCCYAPYYDLLYKDKDYLGEAQHVHGIIQRNSPGTKSILELGCGTCGHAIHLAALGYRVHGVDLSQEMLDRAEKRLKEMPDSGASGITLSRGDIRNVRLERHFDAVIALFHVISYLPTNDDIKAAFQTAKTHLKRGGIFIFDCWYGPAVLTDRPAVRVKRMEDDRLSVVRVAEPVIHANRNLVEVNYQVFISDKTNGKTDIVQETHLMRYLFKPEVELLFANAGFETAECFEWMSGREPGFDTWSVCFVGRS